MSAATHAQPNIRARLSAQSVQRAKQAAAGEYRIVKPVAEKNERMPGAYFRVLRSRVTNPMLLNA